MSKYLGLGAIVVFILIGVWYLNTPIVSAPETEQSVQTETLGSYPYSCENGASFTMEPAADMSTIVLKDVAGAPFGTVTLSKSSEPSNRYVGGEDIVFSGRGETVTITTSNVTMVCNPEANQEEAPFNFGD